MQGQPSIICSAVAVMFAVMSLALAETAGETTYPPVVVGSHTQSSETVTVERGDHLWKISARHLGDFYQRLPSNHEVSPYWRETIEANRNRLRSGDPDLIYPGEQVALPPIEQP
jgi:nucleoid-associated protein YgaU